MSAFVQAVTVQSGGVASLSKSITTTAGNSVICVFCFAGPKSGLALTQTSGDTTTATSAELDDSGTANYMTMRYANSVAGGATTFTFTFTGVVNAVMWVVETTPLKSTTPLDVFSTEASSAATTHAVGPTGALADATEFALAAWAADGSASNTPSVNNAFTIPTNGNVMGSGVTDYRGALAYLDCTSAPSVTLTSSVSITAFGVLAVWRLPPVVGGGTLWAQSLL